MAERQDTWRPSEDFSGETNSKFNIISTENDIHEKLLKIFKKAMGRDIDGKRPLNILVIGTVGVGKSSLLNSNIAAMSDWENGRYIEYFTTGAFTDLTQITAKCNRLTGNDYRQGLGEDEDIDDWCWPTFIDAAGFQDEETNYIKEVIFLLLNGYIPATETLADVVEFGKNNGIQVLRSKYSIFDRKMRVDRVIFVAAANEVLPSNLIKNVVEATKPRKNNNSEVPLYGMMTKVDKINLTDPAFLEKEDKFKLALGIKGTNRYNRCINYCQDVDEKGKRTSSLIARIDVPILKILIQVCTQHTSMNAEDNNTDNINLEQNLIKAPRVHTGRSLPYALIYSALKMGLLAVLLFWCLQSEIVQDDLLRECQQVNGTQLRNICDYNKKGKIMFFVYPSFSQLISLFIFIAVDFLMHLCL